MRNPKLIAAIGMAGALAIGGAAGAALGNPLASGASVRTEAPTTTAPAPTPPKGPRGGPMGGLGAMFDQELGAAAKVLGMSTADLKAELAKGKSLAEIAKAKGVAKQDVIDAIVAAANAHIDELQKELPDAVAKIVDAKLPTGFGPGDHAGGAGGGLPWNQGKDKGGSTAPKGPKGQVPGRMGRGMGLDSVAKVLGTTPQDLFAALRDGKTLAQVAKDKGVAPQKVIDAIVADAKTHLDQAVQKGWMTKDEAAKMLAEITKATTSWVNDGGPMVRPHHN